MEIKAKLAKNAKIMLINIIKNRICQVDDRLKILEKLRAIRAR